MNIVKSFKDSNFRVVENNGKKYISLVDVARFLEYKNEYVQANIFLKRNKELLEDEVINLITTSIQGKEIEQAYLTLSGVLMFLVKTNQKKAIPFQKWVKDVLTEKIIKTKELTYDKARLKSKEIRNNFTDTLRDHGVKKPHEYIQLTYQTKTSLGIDKNIKKDNLEILDLLKISLAEQLSSFNIIQDDLNGYYDIKPVVNKCGKQIDEITKGDIIKSVNKKDDIK